MFGAVILICTYIFLPLLLEKFVAQELQDGLGLTAEPEVDLDSAPPLGAIAGDFEEGLVTFEEPEIAGVRPDEVTVDLEPFNLDVLRSVATGRLKSEGPVSGTLRVELSEEEVARIASFGTAAFVKSVELEEGSFVVQSEAEVFGARVPVQVEGELGLQDGELFFKPGQIEALGEPVPDRLVRGLLGGTEFVFPIGELPFEGEISGIELHEGVLVLTGRAEDLSLG
ncbi:MAG: DUF2993 domain-containing protein [Actinobacteria bacterium]|nr:DUF2993 domain-containing protein [Actinomycetota bacterium]